ncbi:hypothetical protein BBJ28_00010533 [Nothophytophthora sp. Chile5]|nr:hypothetical protein BBJ28_00010533 [Nothophytophthora sp. Chile5]
MSQLGYNVSTYYTTDFVALSGRLKLNDPQSLCTPTHVDLAAPAELSFGTYDWITIGSVGHSKVSGIWTTTDLVADGTNSSKYATPFYADFWKDYTTNDDLISANAVSNLRNNSKYFPPRGMFCFDGVFGCLNQCSKSYACTLREGEGKECLVVAIADFKDVYGYWPSFLSNLGFPAYFCFIGRSGLEEYIVDMQQSGRGVLFYMNQPDDFFSRHLDSFQRVSFPKTSAEKVLLNTWQFGENGYGQPNNNPIAVEYPEDVQQKVCSLNVAAVSSNDPVMALLERFRVLELSMSQLLTNYAVVTANASSVPADPFFESACTWVKGNYDVWRRWMDPLPECTVMDHMTYTVTGCNGSSHRDVSFQWRLPDPVNSSLPFECDGGILELPVPMQSSRSCDWLAANEDEWSKWVTTLPTCDSDFHTYEAMECERTGDRHIIFRWLLPDPTNASLSLECSGAVLPDPIIVACDYVPVQSIGFVIVFVIVMIVLAGIVTCMVLVFKNRNIPIIRRSQFEFLETMLAGTILMCCAALIYAGRPTDGLCVARPVVLAIGLTLIFGSLTVKCLRVYRVFLSKKLTRVVLPTHTMFKILGAFLLIDVVVLLLWFIVDFPSAIEVNVIVNEVYPGATIQAVQCNTSSFLFSALLMFWKAILLGAGLYLSFLIRNVSVDFQESIWMFASSLVVVFGCVMILPLAYMIVLPATTFYYFFSTTLWLCTSVVVALMLVPKMLRQKENASTMTNGSTMWPFVVNNVLFIVLELATGFCTNFTQFLWVRALFGIAMGGLYGNVAATALEDCPPAARGIISGMMQQGYAFGYLLAVVFARALVNTTSHGWRPLFWFGACPPVLIIIARLYLPETKVFQERQVVRRATHNVTKTFLAEGKVAFKRHWMLLIYMVLLMAGFNFMSHGSQDLYPTMLSNQFEFSADEVTVTQVVANLGAITGGTLVGFYSQTFSRRLSILVMAIVGAAILYPYSYTDNTKVMAAAFFEQFCVQGAWGVIPIHLMELSPPSYSTFIVGTSYQLGNLISSASSTIEARLGENFPLPPNDEGVSRYEYGKVICIFMAVVYAYLVLLTFLGPEARGKQFDVAHDRDLEEAANVNPEDLEKVLHGENQSDYEKTQKQG